MRVTRGCQQRHYIWKGTKENSDQRMLASKDNDWRMLVAIIYNQIKPMTMDKKNETCNNHDYIIMLSTYITSTGKRLLKIMHACNNEHELRK